MATGITTTQIIEEGFSCRIQFRSDADKFGTFVVNGQDQPTIKITNVVTVLDGGNFTVASSFAWKSTAAHRGCSC